MKAIILAAGDKQKWGNYLGVPKHLIPIKGEPLLHRTIRLLDERWVDEIVVVAQPEDSNSFVVEPARWEAPRAVERDWVQEMEPSRHLWNDQGRTMLLYGDCYFSEALLDTMVNDTADWNAYARFGPSRQNGKGYGEMFGWVFDAECHDLLDRARLEAMQAYENKQWWRCLGWEVYRRAVNFPVDKHQKGAHFIDWSDESDDFDKPAEWETWKQLHSDLV